MPTTPSTDAFGAELREPHGPPEPPDTDGTDAGPPAAVVAQPIPYPVPPGPFWREASVLERVIQLGAALGCCFVLYLASTLDPDGRGFGTHEQLGLHPCSFKEQTGMPCMTCGMTTCFSHMAHLQVLSAFRVQPAGAVLFCLTVAFVPIGFWTALAGRSILSVFDRGPAVRWTIMYLLLLLASWIYTIVLHASGG